MEEIIDVLDEKTGNRTGLTISKSEAHQKGIWHNAIHILIINKETNKVLMQKRCESKKLYPNTWDIAVGGHVSAGEKPIEAAKRELKEELGLDYEMNFIARTKEQLRDNDIISNEFVDIYLIKEDVDINSIKLQKEEVSDVSWLSKKELNELIDNKKVIPHVEEYKIINNLLGNN